MREAFATISKKNLTEVGIEGRIEELKSIVKGMKLGVYIYRQTLDVYQDHPEKLAMF